MEAKPVRGQAFPSCGNPRRDALGFPELPKISDTLNGLQAMMAGRRARRAFPDGFERRRRQPTGNIKMRGHP